MPEDIASRIAWLEIAPQDDAYFLFYYDATGESLADTWHESLDDAKQQARFEFEIESSDWHPMP